VRLRPHVDERFELECINVNGDPKALLSVVPFEDQDFRAAAFPSPRLRFGQTNYRIYVRDRDGRRAAWFLGTVLGSWTVALPRYVWRLPWHYGRFTINCQQDPSGRYLSYAMSTRSRWAPAQLELIHEPRKALSFPGFPDDETAQVVLTHPLIGYFRRRDGRLGTYSVWHERLSMESARVRVAEFGLLDWLGLVPFAEQLNPYSVMIQSRTEFVIHLPPKADEAPSLGNVERG
jgi:uncharacterized protein YqjF (DUF2071 family)